MLFKDVLSYCLQNLCLEDIMCKIFWVFYIDRGMLTKIFLNDMLSSLFLCWEFVKKLNVDGHWWGVFTGSPAFFFTLDINLKEYLTWFSDYATQDSSGMCHPVPQCYLLEWREEQPFVRLDSWMPKKGLDTLYLPQSTAYTRCHLNVTDITWVSSVADSVRCNNMV